MTADELKQAITVNNISFGESLSWNPNISLFRDGRTKPSHDTMAEDEAEGRQHQQYQEMDWKKCSEWLSGICVVTFDLELGQAMEVCDWIAIVLRQPNP